MKFLNERYDKLDLPCFREQQFEVQCIVTQLHIKIVYLPFDFRIKYAFLSNEHLDINKKKH